MAGDAGSWLDDLVPIENSYQKLITFYPFPEVRPSKSGMYLTIYRNRYNPEQTLWKIVHWNGVGQFVDGSITGENDYDASPYVVAWTDNVPK